jgi:hypothetical protein
MPGADASHASRFTPFGELELGLSPSSQGESLASLSTPQSQLWTALKENFTTNINKWSGDVASYRVSN